MIQQWTIFQVCNPYNDPTMDNISGLSNIDSNKLLTTYQPLDIELYNNRKPSINPDTPISLMCRHIPTAIRS